MTIEPPLTVDEVEAMIARLEVTKSRWHANEGYIRTLDIEITALRLLADKLRADAGA